MMSEFMIRGNTDDVCCVPVTPESIRELGMGMKKETEPSDSVQKLKECVLQYVKELKERKRLDFLQSSPISIWKCIFIFLIIPDWI